MMNKLEPFTVLLQNPGGARYYQDGEFFGPGGRAVDSVVPREKLPFIVQHDLLRRGNRAPGEKVYACPHCDKEYTDKKWLDKHIAGKHE